MFTGSVDNSAAGAFSSVGAFSSAAAVDSEPDPEPDAAAHADVDSDDASDAYTEPFDEDEPMAEFLDQLDNEPALADDDLPEEATEDVPVVRSQENDVQPEIEATPQQNDARSRTHVVFRADNFICRQEDVELLARPRAWLSGDGLSIFLQHTLLTSAAEGVSVIHSRMLWDVEYYLDSIWRGQQARIAANKKEISTALGKAVHPSAARKWLMLGHVPAIPHWTLLLRHKPTAPARQVLGGRAGHRQRVL
ncbi:hypothetical protein AURDEDRAFT_171977 [Auricularia subglabra TFB-10046 SS5]|nr:hypothetical protein AURDEDRAFT_171977 [Auricularia subglabra TFB-10046 SS5]